MSSDFVVSKPGMIQVLHFNRAKNPQDKKFRSPFKTEDLYELLKESGDVKPKGDFCKKMNDVQKRFRCLPCKYV
jgi:hypothetical protein